MIAPYAVPETAVVVPQVYKEHLLQNTRRFYLGLFWLFVLMHGYGFFVSHRVTGISLSLPLMFATKGLIWMSERDRRWKYESNGYYIKLIGVLGNSWFYQWCKLQPGKHVITEVRQEMWQGLPALRLVARTKWPFSQQTLLMVYSEEDRNIVETQWLPIFEEYRPARQGA